MWIFGAKGLALYFLAGCHQWVFRTQVWNVSGSRFIQSQLITHSAARIVFLLKLAGHKRDQSKHQSGFQQYLKVFDAEVQLADLHHQCRRHKLLGSPGACSPWKVFKIGLSKMQFSAFPGPELITKCSQTMKYLFL